MTFVVVVVTIATAGPGYGAGTAVEDRVSSAGGDFTCHIRSDKEWGLKTADAAPSATSVTTWATIPLATFGRACRLCIHQGSWSCGDDHDHDDGVESDTGHDGYGGANVSRFCAGYPSSFTPSTQAKTHRAIHFKFCRFFASYNAARAVIGAACSEANGRYIRLRVFHIEMPLLQSTRIVCVHPAQHYCCFLIAANDLKPVDSSADRHGRVDEGQTA
jgi:hypothetical protein